MLPIEDAVAVHKPPSPPPLQHTSSAGTLTALPYPYDLSSHKPTEPPGSLQLLNTPCIPPPDYCFICRSRPSKAILGFQPHLPKSESSQPCSVSVVAQQAYLTLMVGIITILYDYYSWLRTLKCTVPLKHKLRL